MPKIIDLSARRAKKVKRVNCLTVLLDDAESPAQFFQHHSIERVNGVYNVYGWRDRPDGKALAEQDLSLNIVAVFATEADAVNAFPLANVIQARVKGMVLRSTWPEEWEQGGHWTVNFLRDSFRKGDE
jgi:hypothetical protein